MLISVEIIDVNQNDSRNFKRVPILPFATHPLLTSAPTVHPLIIAAHLALAKLRVTIRELPPLKKVA